MNERMKPKLPQQHQERREAAVRIAFLPSIPSPAALPQRPQSPTLYLHHPKPFLLLVLLVVVTMLEPEPEAKRRRTSGGSEAIITSSPPRAVVASPDVTIATAPVPTTTSSSSSSSQPPSPSVTALLPAPHPLLAPTLLPPVATTTTTTTTTTSTPTTVKKGGRWSREEERGLLTGISVRYPRDAEVQLADDPQAPFKLASFVPSRSVAAIGKRIKALQARVRSGNVRDGLQLPGTLISPDRSRCCFRKFARSLVRARALRCVALMIPRHQIGRAHV